MTSNTKVRVSLTLDPDVVAELDRAAGEQQSRSAFVERVLRRYFRRRDRARLHVRDLERLNRAAARLNEEAAGVLEYQAEPES